MIEAQRVGPVIRAGDLADAVALAIEDDNPGHAVRVTDRGDYIRIEIEGRRCRLTRRSLEHHLGREFPLPQLELEMPSFAGRLMTRSDEYIWYFANPGDRHD